MKKTVFFTHSTAVTALTVLGNSVILMPRKTADEYTVSGYFLSLAALFLLYFVSAELGFRLFGPKKNKKPSGIMAVGFAIGYSIVAVAALFAAANSFYSFTDFIAKAVLPDTVRFFSVVIFAAVLLFFSRRRQEDILKFSLLAFWLVAFLMVFFFLASFEGFYFRNIFVFSLPKAETLLKQAKPYFLNMTLPSLLISAYLPAVFGEKRRGAAAAGIGAGGLLLLLCVLNSVLLFGAPLAGKLEFPYASAVSTVSVGRLFTRLDGFSYFIYFVSSLTQITVALFLIETCLKKLNALLIGN